MKAIKKQTVRVFVAAVFVIMLIVSLDIFNMYNIRKEQDDILSISGSIFNMIDNESLEISYTYLKSELIEKIDSENITSVLRKASFYSVVICDSDVVFFSCEGDLRSVEGYAIIRNDAELSERYPDAGYNEGVISYEKISDKLYRFNAPI